MCYVHVMSKSERISELEETIVDHEQRLLAIEGGPVMVDHDSAPSVMQGALDRAASQLQEIVGMLARLPDGALGYDNEHRSHKRVMVDDCVEALESAWDALGR